ncbi:MAG: hypothetical protein L0H40_11085, partial [Micrococcaceae bacterium]|nr:hypothetical protein [Micrococcaceae bacterium]
MSVVISPLPDRLPDTAAIDSKAKAVRKVGTDCGDIRDDVQSHWSGLGAVFESPHQDKVYAAVTTVLSPPIDAVGTVTDDTAKALEDFSSRIAGLKARYDAVVSRAASHNEMREEARPDDYFDTTGDIQLEVNAVAELYDDAVSTCASKIAELNPLFGDGLKNANKAAGYGGDAVTALTVLGLTASSFEYRDGKLFFVYNSDRNEHKKGFQPKRYGITEKRLQKLGVPKSYAERIADGGGRKNPSYVPKHARLAGNHYIPKHAANPMALAVGGGPLAAKYPWNVKPIRDGAHVRVTKQLTRGPGRHERNPNTRTGPVKLPKALEKVNKFTQGPGGKLLTVAGAGMTFVGAYGEGYNDSVLRNPEMTHAEHQKEARKDAAVVTAAEETGAIVGTAVGRGVGAAVGQALIPIPG